MHCIITRIEYLHLFWICALWTMELCSTICATYLLNVNCPIFAWPPLLSCKINGGNFFTNLKIVQEIPHPSVFHTSNYISVQCPDWWDPYWIWYWKTLESDLARHIDQLRTNNLQKAKSCEEGNDVDKTWQRKFNVCKRPKILWFFCHQGPCLLISWGLSICEKIKEVLKRT